MKMIIHFFLVLTLKIFLRIFFQDVTRLEMK